MSDFGACRDGLSRPISFPGGCFRERPGSFLIPMTANQNIITSPYRRGADFGFIFGLYMSLMFFSSIFASALPLLGLLSLVMVVCVPAVIYVFIRRYDKELQECATFPMMWMLGVVVFVCGILISGALLVVYMKWIEPDFIMGQLQGLIELGKNSPGTALEEAGGIAAQMIEANFIPSPIAIVSEIIMAAIVSGSILSIVISALIALRHKLQRQRRGRIDGADE